MSLDDFGTGYSSLSYLRQFPINKLKIDQSFVHEIGKHRGNGRRSGDAIVLAIIHLARSLELDVVAEGVESRDQVSFLRANGCGVGQGFLFGHPVIARDFWKRRDNED